MAQENNRRSRRIPLTREEVAAVIAFKKKKEQIVLLKLKRSVAYKVFNIFNVICFFIFCELLFCYFGPCQYRQHATKKIIGKHGQAYRSDGKHILDELDVTCVDDKQYKVVVNEFMEVPAQQSSIAIGKDYILRRDLKASFGNSEKEFRIFSASPILFLSAFSSFILLIGILYNLNENEYSLMGLSMICGMTLMCVLFM